MRTTNPVDVVIVNYNGGELLLQAVEAVLASTRAVRLLVVDNASADDSIGCLKARFPEVEVLQNTRNLGFAAAANQGLAAGQADYLLLLNPDCLLQPDTLGKMLKVLKDHPETGMAGCRILNPDGSEQRGCRRELPTLGSGAGKALGRQKAMDLHLQPLPDGPLHVQAVSGAFMLIRRQALADVGLLDEGYFMHCEDLDWCRRFLDAGWKILFVPHVEVTHYQGHCSRAVPVRVLWHKHRGMLRYYRKFLAPRAGILRTAVVVPAIYGRFLILAVRDGLRGLIRQS
ncbi:glycosyltransferase family 2 protein [Thiolapillus brandeum]|uniref:Glycosyl transferase family 2 n=1 Tax=Thiolapillus brandeum TaxID=1076588 RepID=A0A7U6GGW2_9GAMM|nr:glycosyltransferase family 2 protein [Thiolapillus brandeum]BAO43443.1 glycosyl transferase family 2 [Thiolapillus brandeum]